MLNRLFAASAFGTATFARRGNDLGGHLAGWRLSRDIAAVMAALDRLSDRRLHLIGLRGDALFAAVSDLVLRAEEKRADDRAFLAERVLRDRAPPALTEPGAPAKLARAA
ncbi:hypothetical protein LAZ29_02175 [Cereibacter sphaeroides]|uniref:hypothetical protein n=1 Tax=Cereibacter sphaeroides TaxID=1063 RepID=UPI001F1EC926|nr:hypothetical protein [Cereibacter sphaeroides]MCE6949730.1 hypothetical protein [Cereibacter sphaeroides]